MKMLTRTHAHDERHHRIKRTIVYGGILLLLLFNNILQGQTTTGGIKGVVKSQTSDTTSTNTEGLGVIDPSIAIVLTNEATNEKYNIKAQSDGSFALYNLTPGSNYTLSIKGADGQYEESNVHIPLGENLDYGVITLSKDLGQTTKLEEVSITGSNKNSAFSKSKGHGAGTVISKSLVQEMPTSSRSLADLTRLTPQANGNSFAGASNRYNNLQIDGAQNNDAFGLGGGGGLPGAAAGTQPISLDAIQEIQVVLSPYNVTLGNFAGAGVNAITRSGTNHVEGSVYGFLKNNSLQGVHPLNGAESDKMNFYTVGARVGGPIIKDKLFYFVNYELVSQNTPTIYNAGDPGTRITPDQAKTIADFFKNNYNYDVGSYEGAYNRATQNHKVFAKLDYVINAKHKLSIRHNFITATLDDITRNATTFHFGNTAFVRQNLQNVSIAELKSNFNSRTFNSLIVGYSNIYDKRNPNGALFPSVNIDNVGAFLGTEAASNRNILEQHIIELTDNFKMIFGKHTITIGTHNELFLAENSFANRLQGQWVIDNVARLSSVAEFNNGITRFRASYPLEDGGEISKPKMLQLGFYAQSESDFTPRFSLTYGLRIDIPIFLNSPSQNVDFTKQYNIDNSQIGSGQVLWSPRVGFRYHVDDKKTVQIRGGVGIFTGRIPMVFMSNNFANDGIKFGAVDANGSALVASQINNGNGFNPNPDVATVSQLSTGVKSYSVNVADKNFKFPQTLRANLAFDFKLPGDVELTVEGIYSKTINGVYFEKLNFVMNNNGSFNNIPSNIGLTPPIAGTFGPVLFNKPILNNVYINADGTPNTLKSYGGGVYALKNTSAGYSYSVSVQVSKKIDLQKIGKLHLTASYNYGQSKDINSSASSVASSNFGNNYVSANDNFNNPSLAYSLYDIRHRFMFNVGYKIAYAKNYATTISLFYNIRSGIPFSLTYENTDINGDGENGNDLVYIPTETEIKNTSWRQAEKDALNNFITSIDGLNDNRGKYSERNGMRTPWENIIDARVLQDFILNIGGKKHVLQLSWEIFNLGNLLNQDWGRKYSDPLSGGSDAYTAFISSGQLRVNTSNGKPITKDDVMPLSFDARWSMQLGIRYTFN